MSHEEQNSKNLAEVLLAQQTQEGLRREITYEQSNQLVLLGPGHNQADQARIRNQVGDWNHTGRIRIHEDKTKQRLSVMVVPDGGQTSERFQLEEAVRQAIQGMTQKELQAIKKLPVTFDWK